jgi:hypothetical protein
MSRSIVILSALLLAGCDAGKDLLAQGAAKEAAGSFKEAADLYRAVCEKGSPLCPIATQRAERIGLKDARRALDEGRYQDAKAAADAALKASDAGVKRAAEVMSKLADLEKGLAWEQASASADQGAALPDIEAVAAAGVAASPKAREWLSKNRPRILLDRVKAACAPTGQGSCVTAGADVARRAPASPEAAEAQKLVEADYARIYPKLKDAEGLLSKLAYACAENKRADEAHAKECEIEQGIVSFACVRNQEPVQHLPTDKIAADWKKKLDEIHDPALVKPLEVRWPRAEKECEYDAETPPKPAGAK